MLAFALSPLLALATLVATALPSQAYFTGFNASTSLVKPGETILVSFTTSSYPQQNKQYYAQFGLNPTAGYKGLIGTTFGEGKNLITDVVKSSSNAQLLTYNITLPSKLTPVNKSKNTAILGVAVFQVVGASGEASVQTFNTTLKLKSGN